jgi:hypothetical protein
MEVNNVVIYFLVIAGTSIGFLVAVAWTIRSVIVIEVTKRHELFRQQLQIEVSQTLDQFRKAMAEEKMIFGAMQDSRSDSLVQLYGIMIDIAKNGQNLSKPGLNNLPYAVGVAQLVLESINEFFSVYQKNGIYFSDEFCSAMDKIMREHENTFANIAGAINAKAANLQEEQSKVINIQKEWNTFETHIPAVIAEMKNEFRRLIGGSSKWF